MSHLKVFGSICYKHVPNPKRRKLDDKSELMILVGYHKMNAYMLFNPINQKIVISQDIVSNEIHVWDKNSSDAIDKPLMSYDLEKASNDVKAKDIINILDEVEATADMPNTVEIEEGMASTS